MRATPGQIKKLKDLKISFLEDITVEEERELLHEELLDRVDAKKKVAKDLKSDALLENSDWDD